MCYIGYNYIYNLCNQLHLSKVLSSSEIVPYIPSVLRSSLYSMIFEIVPYIPSVLGSPHIHNPVLQSLVINEQFLEHHLHSTSLENTPYWNHPLLSLIFFWNHPLHTFNFEKIPYIVLGSSLMYYQF